MYVENENRVSEIGTGVRGKTTGIKLDVSWWEELKRNFRLKKD